MLILSQLYRFKLLYIFYPGLHYIPSVQFRTWKSRVLRKSNESVVLFLFLLKSTQVLNKVDLEVDFSSFISFLFFHDSLILFLKLASRLIPRYIVYSHFSTFSYSFIRSNF